MIFPLDLDPHVNARGWTGDAERPLGALNAWGNSLPAEEWTEHILMDGFGYRLPPVGSPRDHVEAWGQILPLPRGGRVVTLGLLAAGEMGERELTVDFLAGGMVVETLRATAPSFMVEGADAAIAMPGRFCLSHFHYPGDYDLALLRPALFHVELSPREAVTVGAVRLGFNPLFHVFAASVRMKSDNA